mmetsp:Transcript_27013/g.89671  ORF Transcript_27013/g.89671 Transcript_27013/m.89671 type:complete len:351 (-) Transcript_27013:1963-3015(-)
MLRHGIDQDLRVLGTLLKILDARHQRLGVELVQLFHPHGDDLKFVLVELALKLLLGLLRLLNQPVEALLHGGDLRHDGALHLPPELIGARGRLVVVLVSRLVDLSSAPRVLPVLRLASDKRTAGCRRSDAVERRRVPVPIVDHLLEALQLLLHLLVGLGVLVLLLLQVTREIAPHLVHGAIAPIPLLVGLTHELPGQHTLLVDLELPSLHDLAEAKVPLLLLLPSFGRFALGGLLLLVDGLPVLRPLLHEVHGELLHLPALPPGEKSDDLGHLQGEMLDLIPELLHVVLDLDIEVRHFLSQPADPLDIHLDIHAGRAGPLPGCQRGRRSALPGTTSVLCLLELLLRAPGG